MKKYLLIIAAITVMVASCQKEDNLSKDGKVTVSLSANVDNNQTKVNYVKDASVYKGSWATGDAVSIIAPNNTNAVFSYKSGNEFTGEVTPWTEASDVYGVYPYSSTAYTITDGKLKDFDASSLTIAAGETNSTECLMVAKGNGVSDPMPGMLFKQAMAIVRMNIINVPSGVTVTKVAVINQDMYSNLTLVGKADVNMSTGAIDGTPTYTNKIVADITGAAAGTATYVNIPLFPTTTAAKYSFCVTLSNGKVYKKTLATAKSFDRNTIYTMGYDLSSVAEEDVLFIVSYNADGTATNLSGYQINIKKSGTTTLYESEKLGFVNECLKDNNYFYGEIGNSNILSNGYTVECYFKPVLTSGLFMTGEHKVIGFTNTSGACMGYHGDASSWYSSCTEKTNGGFYTYTNQYTNLKDATFSVYGKNYASTVGKKLVITSGACNWVHLVVTFDASSKVLTIYDDKDNITAFPSEETHHVYNNISFTGSNGNIGFGANSSGVSSAYALIGPAKIWKRTLSVSEVQELYAAEPTNLDDDVVKKK